MNVNKLIQSIAISLIAVPSISLAADVSISDSKFLKKAAQAGHYEVEGSKMAVNKSKNAEVLKFAKQMIQDHSAAGEELKKLAMSKKVELPADPSFMQKGSLLLLETFSSRNFDEEYIENVGVEAHEATIELFEKAAKSADDAEIKQFANKTLPTLRHHFEMTKKLDHSVD